MNNFNKKNIILQNEPSLNMPYVGSNSLNLKNGIFNSSRINNTFGQLVANDLYIENILNNSGQNIGPKTLTDDEIGGSVNGTKWFDISNERFRINHKIDNGELGTDNLIYTNISENTYFIKKFGNYIIAGTEFGLYYSIDGQEFIQISNCDGIDAYVDDNHFFIASGCGIYECIQTPDFEQKLTLKKLNLEDIQCVTCIKYDSVQQKLYIGNCQGQIYCGPYISEDTPISFELMCGFDENMMNTATISEINVGNVNDIEFLDEYDDNGNKIATINNDNFIIASTDSGIYSLQKYRCLKNTTKNNFNSEILGLISFNGNMFSITDKIVSKMKDNGEWTVLSSGIQGCVGLKKTRDDSAYLITQKQIYNIHPNGDEMKLVYQMDTTTVTTIRDFDRTQNGINLIACSNGIRSFKDGKLLDGVILGGHDILQIYVPNSPNCNEIYVRDSNCDAYIIYDIKFYGGTLTGEPKKITLPQECTLDCIIPSDENTMDMFMKMKNWNGLNEIYRYNHIQTIDSPFYENFERISFTFVDESYHEFDGLAFLNDGGPNGVVLISFTGSYKIYKSIGGQIYDFPSSTINKQDIGQMKFFSYDGKRYSIVISNTVYTYENDDSERIFRRISQDKIVSNKITKISSNKFLIGTQNGLYVTKYISDSIQIPYKVNQDIGTQDLYRVIKNDTMQKVSKYLFLTEQYVMKSDDYRTAKTFMDIGSCSPSEKTTAKDIVIQDMYHYCVGGNCGIYNTSYSYTVSNDFDTFGEDDFEDLYESMQDSIKERIENAVFGDHVSEHHNNNSLITMLNKKMKTDFSNLSSQEDWPKITNDDGNMSIKNDFVKTVDFGSYGDGKINVHMENHLISADSVSFTYILKTWYSGMRELYIYIPTTNTYYLPHNQGCPNCSLNQEKILRKNLMQFGTDKATVDGDINSHCSKFTVELDNSIFSIDDIIDIQANGNSLPLRIYKDVDMSDRDGEQSKMFHSFILPTVLVKQYINNIEDDDGNEDGGHIFKFACFGTDAQALKLQFYDFSAFNEKQIFIVRFNPNGGSGTMDNQNVIYDAEKSKKLKTNMFTYQNGQRQFIGWSCYPSPSSLGDVQFKDMAYIGLSYLPQDIRSTLKVGGTVNLYAVWGHYELDDDASTLTLNSTNEQFYIDSVEIDPTTKYGNNVVISYGD